MSRGWDAGVRCRSDIVTAADREAPPLDLAFVRDKVLRVVDDGYGDDHIEHLIWSAVAAAEAQTHRTIAPATLALVLDRFPCWAIELPGPPLISISAVTYVDTDGATQTLTTSPESFQTVPSGRASRAQLVPLYGEVWPVTRCQPEAVRIEYRAGYEDPAAIPVEILTGMYVYIAELYKQRDLSVVGTNTMVPSVLQLDRFWRPVY
jgi:uncharacterized phiE125 gp8 family phage protein